MRSAGGTDCSESDQRERGALYNPASSEVERGRGAKDSQRD